VNSLEIGTARDVTSPKKKEATAAMSVTTKR